MHPVHNETWYTVGLVHNKWYTKEIGTQWDWYTMNPVHNEIGTQWTGTGTQWDWYTMTEKLVHNGMELVLDWYTV